MFLSKIHKKEGRRKVKDHKKSITINPKYLKCIGSARRNYQDRGNDKIRSNSVGSSSGIYYNFSDKQKNIVVNKIIEILEMESMGRGNVGFDTFR